MMCVSIIYKENNLITVSYISNFLFLFNLIVFLIICWHLYDISNANINNFDYKIIEEIVITFFFLYVCINISYVILKCFILVKDAKEWLKSVLLYKLKKVLLHFFFTLKSHTLKTFVYIFDIITISVTFIKCHYFIITNVVFNISFCTLKTFQHFFYENVIVFKITVTFSV